MRVEREKLGDWFIYGREVAWKYSLTSVGRPAARSRTWG
jgi:hypothetical protein